MVSEQSEESAAENADCQIGLAIWTIGTLKTSSPSALTLVFVYVLDSYK